MRERAKMSFWFVLLFFRCSNAELIGNLTKRVKLSFLFVLLDFVPSQPSDFKHLSALALEWEIAHESLDVG